MSTDAGTAMLPLAEQLISQWEKAASRTLRRQAFNRLHRCDEWDSPYGAVIEDLPVVGSAGTLYVKAVNTFACFDHAARLSAYLFDYMSGLVRDFGILTIALYTDGVVPRNKTRPDKAGSFEAVRMTLCQFPHWLRTRKGLRWIPLCYPTHDEMERAKVSVSNIVIALLKFWFPAEIGTHSWENGVLLTHEGREPVVLRMRMGPMPQDADAFKHVFSLKGSSGQSPCPWCENACTVCRF